VLRETDSSFVRRETDEIVNIDLSLAQLPLDRPDEKPLDAPEKRTADGVSKRTTKADANLEREVASAESQRPLSSESSIDWSLEAQRSAHRAAAADKAPQARAFGTIPASPYRPCEKRESSFKWDPEPKKAGFAGGLPYVQLGKRCIVGLGFFGCTLGAMPSANGTLLDDMKTENRERSSVPSSDDCLQAAPVRQATPASRTEESPRDDPGDFHDQ
jgi:hypothetical protein